MDDIHLPADIAHYVKSNCLDYCCFYQSQNPGTYKAGQEPAKHVAQIVDADMHSGIAHEQCKCNRRYPKANRQMK